MKGECLQNLVAIVLVGGRSSRMNYEDKMDIRIGNDSFLECILKELSFFEHVIISANCEQACRICMEKLSKQVSGKLHLVVDQYEDIGPMGGIYSAMNEIVEETYFVVSCDMPFLKYETIKELYNKRCPKKDATVGTSDGKIQPLFSIYSRNANHKLLRQIENQDYKMMNLLEKLEVEYVEINDRESLYNVNTPEDYNEVKLRYMRNEERG